MESPTTIIPFNFPGLRLREACWINGKLYFTRRAIGELLEYSKPEEMVDTIIRGNPYIKSFAAIVNLTTPDEVYNVIGLQLIIMESDQPKTKEFKITAAHLIEVCIEGKLTPSKWSPKGDLSSIYQIFSFPGGFKRKRLIADWAAREGIAVATAYGRLQKFGSLKKRDGTLRKTRAEKNNFKRCPEYKAVLVYRLAHPNAGGKEIKGALDIGLSVSTINRWLRT